jgi:hypothetical protein
VTVGQGDVMDVTRAACRQRYEEAIPTRMQ